MVAGFVHKNPRDAANLRHRHPFSWARHTTSVLKSRRVLAFGLALPAPATKFRSRWAAGTLGSPWLSTDSALAKHHAKLLDFAKLAFCGTEDLSHDDYEVNNTCVNRFRATLRSLDLACVREVSGNRHHAGLHWQRGDS